MSLYDLFNTIDWNHINWPVPIPQQPIDYRPVKDISITVTGNQGPYASISILFIPVMHYPEYNWNQMRYIPIYSRPNVEVGRIFAELVNPNVPSSPLRTV
jgi:hypothetical protein